MSSFLKQSKTSKVTAWQSWEKHRNIEVFTVDIPKGGDLPWALFYPADYSVGSSNLGIQYIFRMLREKGVAVERFFERPIPFRSVDGDTMLERFPIITAGISYEPDVVSFYKWLKNAGIPLSIQERENGNFPIVGVGGAITYINPLIISAACDFIVLGDTLQHLDFLIDCLRHYMSHMNRSRLWSDLSKNDSILVPPIHIKDGVILKKRVLDKETPLTTNYPIYSTWITPSTVFESTLLLELQRGCIRSCKYCTLPNSFGKMRFRSFKTIENQLDILFSNVPISKVGLVSPEASDYPDLEYLLDYLKRKDKGISFASLRVDRLSEKMLESLVHGGRYSITIAPETGTDKLRSSCGKSFTNKTIIEKLLLAVSYGVTQVKLYFMIGLPGETEEDVVAIAGLCKNIIEITGQNLVVSIGPFIPKPGTRWQTESFISISSIRKKYKIISGEFRKIKKPVQLRFTSPKEALQEYKLTWYSCNDSMELISSVEKDLPIKNHFSREDTIKELETLW